MKCNHKTGNTVCGGTVTDGFCDDCGKSPIVDTIASTVSNINSSSKLVGITSRVTGARRPIAQALTTSSKTGTAGTGKTHRGTSRGSSSRRRALGGGLVQIETVLSQDPLTKVMTNLKIPAEKCFCPVCEDRYRKELQKYNALTIKEQEKNNPPIKPLSVNPEKNFCLNCGTPYNFKPTLKAGDVVASQYEIKGPMALGGMGWIYLGLDKKLNRWVVLKGLINSKDEAVALAAAEERRFLAEVKHGKIVGIYNFVSHGKESYIVMEYVGGKTLKEMRKEKGPLPVEQAISFILGILPAFSYLHEQKMIYCDFKPENCLQENNDLKLIDLGAVRKLDNPNGDIYTTVGFYPPELDPSDPNSTFNIDETTDLYTLARSLMVLMMDFSHTRKYRYTVPEPNELMFTLPENKELSKYTATLQGGIELPTWMTFDTETRTFSGLAPEGLSSISVTVKAQNSQKQLVVTDYIIRLPFAECESLYRFCLKATDKNPDNRFQNAEEMSGQLLGILREIVAIRGQEIPRFESDEFFSERDPGAEINEVKNYWKYLPPLKLDQEDEASADIYAMSGVVDVQKKLIQLKNLCSSKPNSSEAYLRTASLLINDFPLNDVEVLKYLDAAKNIDNFDWRPDWYCGKLYLEFNKYGFNKYLEAVECFDSVYKEMPGELTPKLGLAIALEGAGRISEAKYFYNIVTRVDPSYAMAAFGLARCETQVEKKVQALNRIPASSSSYSEAQLAMIRYLTEDASPASFEYASDILATVTRKDIPRYKVEADLALGIARKTEAGTLRTKTLLGISSKNSKDFRSRAEQALRLCARQAQDTNARIEYVEIANSIRPLTLF